MCCAGLRSFLGDNFQGFDVERLIGDELLEAAILILELSELREIAHFQTAVLRSPVVHVRFADAVFRATSVVEEARIWTPSWGYASDSYTWLFGVSSSSGSNCQIDNLANETCTGTITGYGGVSVRHRTSEGRHVLAYAAESATRTIEDVGTARMSDGVANVQINPAFASVMDRQWYYVLLTPLGDTRGLYVSMKTASGFQVRENEGGRSRVEFDYRIVAHPLDAKEDRLPPAPAEAKRTRPVQ